MSSVAVTIQELFESGQSPIKICDLLKIRASRSGVFKVLNRLKDTSAFPKVKSTPSRKVRTPKPRRRSVKILEETCKNWFLLLVSAME